MSYWLVSKVPTELNASGGKVVPGRIAGDWAHWVWWLGSVVGTEKAAMA